MSSTTRRSVGALIDGKFILIAGLQGYLCIAVMQQEEGPAAVLAATALSLLALGWTWLRTEPSDVGRVLAEPSLLRSLRGSVWGAGAWFIVEFGASPQPAFSLVAVAAMGLAVVAGATALARVPPGHGLAEPRSEVRSRSAAIGVALAWGPSAALAVAGWAGFGLGLVPSSSTTNAAAVVSMLVLLAACFRMKRLRRLEMGVVERASGAFSLVLGALIVSVPVAIANLAPPSRVLSVGALGAALGCSWAMAVRDVAAFAPTVRAVVALVFLGAPLVVIFATLVRNLPDIAGELSLLGGSLAMGLGLVARQLVAPLLAQRQRWLLALRKGNRAALELEPQEAINAILVGLKQLGPSVDSGPELWRLDPPAVMWVDVAGYLHLESGTIPQGVFELARGEPEQVLRRSVLSEVRVHRPEVRAALTWMDSRGAMSAIVVGTAEEEQGVLLLPCRHGDLEMTLEEARACRSVAARLGSVLSVSSSLDRSRQRETRTAEENALLRTRLQEQERRYEDKQDGGASLVKWLARAPSVAAYCAKAQDALVLAQRLAMGGTNVHLVTSPGADVLGWAAMLHLKGANNTGPLVVVDATCPTATLSEQQQEKELEPWQMAKGGTLLLLNAHCVSESLGKKIARELETEESRVSPRWIFSTGELPKSASNTLKLLRTAKARALTIPSLAERPGDLRGLVLDALCRSGERRPEDGLGCDVSAMSELINYSWPGNERELASVVQCAAHRAIGRVVRSEDIEGLTRREIRLSEMSPSSTSQQPPTSSRRGPGRHSGSDLRAASSGPSGGRRRRRK